ncbi:MAG: molybdopterin-binding protein [Eubacteriales bacterium]|nr:molybdopterin-binding protein [Eubacteriales bacterium]
MKLVKTEDAVGMVLCHDMTEIIPGVKKGAAFRKGHIVTEEDIPHLLDIGKRHLYVWDLQDGYVHEDDAARRMAKAVCGAHISGGVPSEGKINLKADCDGILKINREAVYALCQDEEICLATIRPDRLIRKGKLIAGTRVIPLAVKETVVQRFEAICSRYAPVMEIVPLKPAKIGIVITGSEIQSGRIKDGFGDVLRAKAKETGAQVIGQVLAGDDAEDIAQAIRDFIAQGATLVEVTGGMSVDPDDRTPAAIRLVAEPVSYGAPVLPGAMFMVAYAGDVPVVGLPGCVMFAKRTIFDLIVPRLLAGERITRQDIIAQAVGGLCESCEICTYPACGFGG